MPVPDTSEGVGEAWVEVIMRAQTSGLTVGQLDGTILDRGAQDR
jgi:hypothetical protein